MILCKFSFILYVKTFASLHSIRSRSLQRSLGASLGHEDLIFDENHGLESNHCLGNFLPRNLGEICSSWIRDDF